MREIYLKFSEKGKYDVKIETIEEMSSSIFLDSYIQAYKELYTISFESKNNDEIDRNNIIAFLGERGSGKTSCMRSFLSSLSCLDEHNFILEDEKLKKNLEKFSEINFEILNIVEPSFFSEKINVIELVVSNMFKNFSIEIEKNNKDYEMKRTLLKNFQEIFKNMKYMKCSEAYQNSEIEELITLSTSVDLKKHLSELIEQYLKLFSKDKLIISIDDIDLNTKFAYSMTEDVRKYLSIPNVIIVLALKLEQLKTIITKEYIEEYEHLLKDKTVIYDDYNRYVMEDIENRVEKYLLKLIPYERRIYLKNPESYDENIKIFINKEQISLQSEKFQDAILKFIFQKTNMLFLKPEYGVNKVIPTSLRELVGFVAILEKLKKPLNNDQEMKIKNYEFFENYLYSYIFKDKLSEKEQNIIRSFLLVPYNKKNSYIVSKLLSNDKENNTVNTPLDLTEVIKTLREIEDNISYFPFCLRMTYSYLLYKTFYENRKDKNNNFLKLLGKDYLKNLEKYNLFNVNKKFKTSKKLKSNEIFNLFILENDKKAEEEKGKYYFSLIAPFYNIIFNSNSTNYLQSFIFRNMEIYERFYSFLENVEFERIDNNIDHIWENIKNFYEITLRDFIDIFSSPLNNELEIDLQKFIKELNSILPESLKELKEYIENKNEEKGTKGI